MQILKNLIIFFVIFFTMFAKWDFRGNETENYAAHNLEIRITSNKSRYYYNEEIELKLRISNNGYYPVTVYLSPNDRKNFTIIVKNKKGLSLPIKPFHYNSNSLQSSDPFYKKYTGTGYHVRNMVIHPGETIEKKIILKDWVDFNAPPSTETYYITAFFYPNPDQSNDYFLQSENTYPVMIDPISETSKQPSAFYNISKGSISPREIVFLTLASEYKKEWSTFFKHISEKDIIKAYPDFAYKYARASESEKNIIINEFLEYLKNRKTHELVSFNVLDEKINDILHSPYKNAQVKVKATRKIEGYEREFIYTYFLTSTNNTWLITGIETQVVR